MAHQSSMNTLISYKPMRACCKTSVALSRELSSFVFSRLNRFLGELDQRSRTLFCVVHIDLDLWVFFLELQA
jgi:hypothetical protein